MTITPAAIIAPPYRRNSEALLSKIATKNESIQTNEAFGKLSYETPTQNPNHNLDIRFNGAVVTSIDNLERQACIAHLLSWLFHDRYVLVGTSVLDALDVLVNNLLAFVDIDSQIPLIPTLVHNMYTNNDNNSLDDDNISSTTGATDPIACRSQARIYIIRTIGGLASHRYYAEQMTDMVSFLFSRMEAILAPGQSDSKITSKSLPLKIPAESGEHSSSYELFERREAWILQAIYQVIVSANGMIGINDTLSTHSASSRRAIIVIDQLENNNTAYGIVSPTKHYP